MNLRNKKRLPTTTTKVRNSALMGKSRKTPKPGAKSKIKRNQSRSKSACHSNNPRSRHSKPINAKSKEASKKGTVCTGEKCTRAISTERKNVREISQHRGASLKSISKRFNTADGNIKETRKKVAKYVKSKKRVNPLGKNVPQHRKMQTRSGKTRRAIETNKKNSDEKVGKNVNTSTFYKYSNISDTIFDSSLDINDKSLMKNKKSIKKTKSKKCAIERKVSKIRKKISVKIQDGAKVYDSEEPFSVSNSEDTDKSRTRKRKACEISSKQSKKAKLITSKPFPSFDFLSCYEGSKNVKTRTAKRKYCKASRKMDITVVQADCDPNHEDSEIAITTNSKNVESEITNYSKSEIIGVKPANSCDTNYEDSEITSYSKRVESEMNGVKSTNNCDSTYEDSEITNNSESVDIEISVKPTNNYDSTYEDSDLINSKNLEGEISNYSTSLESEINGVNLTKNRESDVYSDRTDYTNESDMNICNGDLSPENCEALDKTLMESSRDTTEGGNSSYSLASAINTSLDSHTTETGTVLYGESPDVPYECMSFEASPVESIFRKNCPGFIPFDEIKSERAAAYDGTLLYSSGDTSGEEQGLESAVISTVEASPERRSGRFQSFSLDSDAYDEVKPFGGEAFLRSTWDMSEKRHETLAQHQETDSLIVRDSPNFDSGSESSGNYSRHRKQRTQPLINDDITIVAALIPAQSNYSVLKNMFTAFSEPSQVDLTRVDDEDENNDSCKRQSKHTRDVEKSTEELNHLKSFKKEICTSEVSSKSSATKAGNVEVEPRSSFISRTTETDDNIAGIPSTSSSRNMSIFFSKYEKSEINVTTTQICSGPVNAKKEIIALDDSSINPDEDKEKLLDEWIKNIFSYDSASDDESYLGDEQWNNLDSVDDDALQRLLKENLKNYIGLITHMNIFAFLKQDQAKKVQSLRSYIDKRFGATSKNIDNLRALLES